MGRICVTELEISGGLMAVAFFFLFFIFLIFSRS